MFSAVPSAGGAALLWGAVAFLFVHLRRRRDARAQVVPGYTGDACAAGVRRATRHRVVLRSRGESLPLDVCVAPPPGGLRTTEEEEAAVVVVYVLDPEPMLFGAATLFAFARATRAAAGGVQGTDPAGGVFRSRMVIVGVGRAGGGFGLSGAGLDVRALDAMREADALGERFVAGLVDEVIPFVEARVLGFVPGRSPPVRRALLGHGFSALAAVRAMIHRPGVFDDYVLGSPPAVLDVEVLDHLGGARAAAGGVKNGESSRARMDPPGALVMVGERERSGRTAVGKLHPALPAGVRDLAQCLRGTGVQVVGPCDVPGEDHHTVGLSVVSRGLTWVANRACGRSREDEEDEEEED